MEGYRAVCITIWMYQEIYERLVSISIRTSKIENNMYVIEKWLIYNGCLFVSLPGAVFLIFSRTMKIYTNYHSLLFHQQIIWLIWLVRVWMYVMNVSIIFLYSIFMEMTMLIGKWKRVYVHQFVYTNGWHVKGFAKLNCTEEET